VTTTLPAAPARTPALGRSSVAKKQIMAVTGLLMFLFILGHMVGNLKFFFGPAKFDHYAEWLRTLLTPLLPRGWYLWLQRGGLTAVVLLHIWAATSLTIQSRRARPIAYAQRSNVQATYASRTMRWGGVIILLFVIFHIADLTAGAANPGFVRGEVFRNTVATFERWYVSAFYILANAALCLHLYHGIWSMAQTLGANRPKYDAALRNLSKTLALVIFVGFISVPVAVMAGYRG
jgi:succinate dehydrogenase / fumarate reductase cytochrome b subunit